MKTAKDLVVGDTCYVVDVNGDILTTKIAAINFDERTETFRLTYTNRCKGSGFFKNTTCNMGGYSTTVYFNKEDAIRKLDEMITNIQKNKNILLTL